MAMAVQGFPTCVFRSVLLTRLPVRFDLTDNCQSTAHIGTTYTFDDVTGDTSLSYFNTNKAPS